MTNEAIETKIDKAEKPVQTSKQAKVDLKAAAKAIKVKKAVEKAKAATKPKTNTRAKVLQNAAAMPAGTEVDEQRFPVLGNLAWYSLTDVKIKRGDLMEMLAKHNIPVDNMPPEISPANAFRRATTKVNKERSRHDKLNADGTTNVVLIRNVANNEREIVKHIIAEKRDETNKMLSYEQVGTLIFDRDLGEMRGTAHANYNSVVNAALEYYEAMCEFYNGKAMRALIRGLVHGTNPVNVRPAGGVYFISKEHEAIVNSLEGFVKDTNAFAVSESGEAVFEFIPLLDMEKQRKMIFDKYESQCESSVEATLTELADVLKSDAAPSKRTIAAYVTEVKTLKAGIETYEALLERDMDTGRAKLAALQMQVAQLLNKAAVSALPTTDADLDEGDE